MTTKTQQFDVTYICPWNGREVTSLEVPAESIWQDVCGEMVYRYNDSYPNCPIITACEVPQSRLDAKRAYFNKYGTACE